MKSEPPAPSLGMPLSEVTDVAWLREVLSGLWRLLDNIDTIDDMVASDMNYRKMAKMQVNKRFELLTTDGYSLHRKQKEEH